MKYDIIIETTGDAKAFSNAICLARHWGIVGCIGMTDQVKHQQNLIVVKSLAILGSIGATGEFESMLDFIIEHEDVVKKLISHYIPIAQIEDALATGQRRDEAMKVVLQV